MAATPLRRLALAVLAMLGLAASGCRTAGISARPAPDLAQPRPVVKVSELFADHNKNAARIETIEAAPQIHVAVSGRAPRYVSGKLFMERPRNFNLRLRAAMAMMDVANIGSNDEEFWVWGKDDRDPAVYYCNYDENGVSPLATSLQPDWIIQSMGLRVVPDEEMEKTTVENGVEPDTLILTYLEKTPRGESLLRETLLQKSTGRIREQRISTADGKTLIALAKVSGFNDWRVPGEDAETVYLPANLRIEWAQEKMTLDVALKGVEVNKKFGSRAAELFAEPRMEGIARKNLAELRSAGPAPSPSKPSSTRDSLPAPAPRVRLNPPISLGLLGTRRREESDADAAPSSVRGVEALVGAPVPTASDPGPAFVQASSGWRAGMGPGVER